MSAGPFAATRPALVAVGVYALATIMWLALGPWLPGDRWLAVHLFTLGALTNAVVAFTAHFALALTRGRGTAPSWHTPVLNVGVALVLAAVTWEVDVLTGLGATIVALMVADNLRSLRAMRRTAVGARFGWVVLVQEWAHVAFLAAAVLGAAMAIGALPGRWWVGLRMAHVHANVLGWGGLTLLSTLVFFGPTMTRTRIVPGADDRAAQALRVATACLAGAVLALAGLGLGAPAARWLRVAAGILLLGHAGAAAVTCDPVARAARSGAPTAARWHVVAVATWYPPLVAVDAVAVATGRWWLLDALGLGMLVAVLGQAVAATFSHVAPTLRPRATRPAVLARLERVTAARALAWNVGALGVVVAAMLRDRTGALLATTGWVLVAAALADLAWRALAPARSVGQGAADAGVSS